MGSSYFIYENYCNLVTSATCCFEVYKINQLTRYELEEFFRSLQDLLVLSLHPSLSFDSAEFLSRRLDGFERTLSVLSTRLRVYAFRIGPTYNYFLTSTLSYLLSVNKGNIVRTYLISLCLRRRKNNFQPPE